jgi:hypothetical protein
MASQRCLYGNVFTIYIALIIINYHVYSNQAFKNMFYTFE